MTAPLAVLVPVAAAAVLVAALTGCTPAGGHHSPSGAASTPAAIVTGSAADSAVPQAALDLDCARVNALPALAAAYGGAGVMHPIDPLVYQGNISADIPDADVFQTLGGISCNWSNGAPAVSEGEHGAPIEVQLAILPNAVSQWARYDAMYGAAGEGVQCNSTDVGLDCVSEQLVGTNWVELSMFGVAGESQANDLAAAVSSTVSSAAPGAPAWAPPRGTTTFGNCTQLLTPSQVATDLGLTGTTVQFTTAAGGWSIQAAARDNADAVGCLFQYADEDNIVGQVNWLRGGAWALDAAVAVSAVGWGTPTPAPIAGLAGGDRAQIRCTDPSVGDGEAPMMCTVDLVLGGNWIQVVIEPSQYDPYINVGARAAALAVAAHLVSGYHAHAH
jgi:hypothetical protein